MTAASLFWLTTQVAIFSFVGAMIFLIARRRGPAAAAASAATVLTLTLPLLLISLSPWPRWEIAANAKVPAIQTQPKDEVAPLTAHAEDLSTIEISATAAEEPPQESAIAAMWRKANEVLQASQEPAENGVIAEPPAWRTWLPWAIAAGVAIGLARLLIGIWAVHGYRECSTPVNDEGFLQLVHDVEHQLTAPKVLLTLRREEGSGTDVAVEQNPIQDQRPAAIFDVYQWRWCG